MDLGGRDTIFAMATGSGRAAVAVVRISGPEARRALELIGGALPEARRATIRSLRDPATGRILDRALILWFPGPGSFTGEDCAELHLHGGRAVLAATLGALAALPRCRLARPGEFTRRAFRNGKMDLAEVEGLADLIEAQTEAQRRQALRQLDGVLGAWVAVQRDKLLRALAATESAIDFADEGDVADGLGAEVQALVTDLLGAITLELDRSRASERIREGFTVVIAGPANAGKSTLLNALARRDVAIVSPQAGTTRDPIAVDLDIEGQLVHVVDTAGLRESTDEIERLGMIRTRQRAQAADLVLWLHDARAPCPPDPALGSCPVWVVATKTDLLPGPPPGPQRTVSALTGAGLPDLIRAIQGVAVEGAGSGDGVATRQRHRDALLRARDGLQAIQAAGDGLGLELVADELRSVTTQLESLVGRIEPEEVLGAIFARFCIGK